MSDHQLWNHSHNPEFPGLGAILARNRPHPADQNSQKAFQFPDLIAAQDHLPKVKPPQDPYSAWNILPESDLEAGSIPISEPHRQGWIA